MPNNFVKFQRGTNAAYQALKTAGTLDANTLYFIYAEDNASTGSLYLGERGIGGGEATVVSTALADLTDVIITETGTNSFLVLNSEGKWVSQSANTVASLILSARTFNETTFVESDTGVVSFKGYDTAETGMVPAKGADGNITWVKPADEEVQALQADVGKASTETEAATGLHKDVEDLQNAVGIPVTESQTATGIYAILDGKADAADTYTKAQVDAAIADAGHLKRVIVNELPDASTADPNTIYMVPLEGGTESDVKAEYMVIDGVWEKIGDTKVDLSGYATTTDLENKVDKVDGSRLMTDAEGTKLGGIAEGAEVNVINAVSEDFTIGENRTLILNNISSSKITDLASLLNAKANQTDFDNLADRVTATEAQLTWTEMTGPTV